MWYNRGVAIHAAIDDAVWEFSVALRWLLVCRRWRVDDQNFIFDVVMAVQLGRVGSGRGWWC